MDSNNSIKHNVINDEIAVPQPIVHVPDLVMAGDTSLQSTIYQPPKPAVERMQAYTSRMKKETELARSASYIIDNQENNLMVDADKNIEIVTESSKLSKTHTHRPKTAAERMREYRARKRSRRISEMLPDGISKRPKTVAERMREYRARKRRKNDNTKSVTSNFNQPSENINGGDTYNVEFIPNNSISRPRTVTERVREYRARKRRKIDTADNVSSNINQPKENINGEATVKVDFILNNTIRRAKTVAERMREYRARKKSKINNAKISSSLDQPNQNINGGAIYNVELIPNNSISRPKTMAERVHKHRLNKKKNLLYNNT